MRAKFLSDPYNFCRVSSSYLVLSPGFEKNPARPGQNFKNPDTDPEKPGPGHEQIVTKNSDKKTRTLGQIFVVNRIHCTVKFAVYGPIVCKPLILRQTASFVANIHFFLKKTRHLIPKNLIFPFFVKLFSKFSKILFMIIHFFSEQNT